MSKANMALLKANLSKLVSSEKLGGIEYLVMPAVLITEGVHNNIFYPAEELAKHPESWNGRPLPVFHPVNEDGDVITANSPATIDEWSVGNLFNVNFEAANSDHKARLVGETWIDTEKLKQLAEDGNDNAVKLAEMLENGDVIEVSTGLFTDDDNTPGKWNGESYTATACNHRPDHFALLPGGKGACSVGDGAGMPRINAADDDVTESKLMKILHGLFSKVSRNTPLTANELTHNDTERAIDALMRTELILGPNMWFHIHDVSDDWFIFHFENDSRMSHQLDTGLFRRGYTISDTDVITLNDDITKVVKRTEYVPQVNSPTVNKAQMKVNGQKLAKLLNDEIDKKVTETMSRADIIKSMATAAGITASTVNQILNTSIDVPPNNRLIAFARFLGLTQASVFTAAGATPTTNEQTTGVKIMNEKIDKLIANESNDWTEADKATLMKLNETDVDAMLNPATVEDDEAATAAAAKLVADEAAAAAAGTAPVVNADDAPVTMGEINKLFKDVLPGLINNGIKALADNDVRPGVLARLKLNDSCQFSDEILEDMKTNALVALEQQLEPDLYDGQGSIRANVDEGDVIAPTPSIHGNTAAGKE